jgi:hypothetical protein
LGDRQLRRELGGDLVVRDQTDRSSDTWDLRPDTDKAAFGWPTDRALLDLVARSGRRDFARPELADLLHRAGYRGLDDDNNAGDYAVDTHPLIRPHGRFRRRRWSVLDVTATGGPDGGGPPRGLVH